MFRGSIVALVTPMQADGLLDLATLERLLEFHAEAGTDAVVIAGTTGESPTLGGDELEALVEAAVRLADRRFPIIAGSGTNDTRRTIELTRRVTRAGADGVLVVTPYYNKPSQTGLMAHFVAVAGATDLPVLLYNVPGRTACDLLPETVAALAETDNICGLKDATPGTARLAELKELCADDFCLLSGDDASACAFMLAGGDGVVSVSANVVPAAVRAMCDAALAGDAEEAGRIDATLQALAAALFVEGNPIPVKWAAQKMGLIGPGIRLPLTPLADEHKTQVLEAMQEAGIEIGQSQNR